LFVQQQKKGAKKAGKAQLGGGMKSSRNDMLQDFSQYDDFDDFMWTYIRITALGIVLMFQSWAV